MKFSILMSIYHKEKPEYFNRAIQSIWDEQSVKPDEIVLIQDYLMNYIKQLVSGKLNWVEC